MKRWNRGENSCSRCDFEYLPVPNLKRAYHKENDSVKSCESNVKLSVPVSRKPCDDKLMDVKKEEKVRVLMLHVLLFIPYFCRALTSP